MKIPFLRRKNRFWIGFTAGLGAGIIASGGMLLLSVLFGGVSLPEEFGSALTGLMPAPLFEYLHQAIGEAAKHIFFYGILAGQCLVFALSGGLYNQRVNAGGEGLRWEQGLLLALTLWLFAGVVLLPLTGAGIFGANLSAGIGRGMLSLAVVGLAFGLLLVLFENWLLARIPGEDTTQASRHRNILDEEAGESLSRRALLKKGVILVGIAAIGVGLWRFITAGVSSSKVSVSQLMQHYRSKIVPPPTPNYGELVPVQFLSPEVTSNDQYYIVSKNLSADPTVDAASWHLRVDGQVDNPYSLSYQELLALPMQQQYESMMCVSNDVGGPYMSNALWEGVRLVDLLQRAGVKAGATKIVFHAADNYTDSIHLSKALEPTTLLAVRMNGVALPQEHGFPARMLVPGIYGMKHCKWVTGVEVVNYDFQGYWQQRGWSDAAPIRMTSRIDTPLDGTTVPLNRITYMAGVAFSGNKGISEVDVSTDSGQSWQRATLKRPLSNLAWVLWEYAWQPRTRGTYIVVVRAIDLAGNVQNPNEEPPLPNGSSGYHNITVIVS